MKKATTMLLALLLHVAPCTPWGIRQPQPLLLDALVVPAYPNLARLAGMEGIVPVNLTVDSKCTITTISIGSGPSLLVDAVTPAVYGGSFPITFRPCSNGNVRTIRISYIFALRGNPTNEWCPTYVRISDDGSSFAIKITTTPADLDALGLAKKAKTERREKENLGKGEPAMNLALPGYPPLARTGNVQGEVKVAVELDSKCQVSAAHIIAGHPLLDSPVLDALRDWRFPSCSGGGEHVDLGFRFGLDQSRASVRDKWAPTYIRISHQYEFEITTAARNLLIYN